LSRTLVGTRTVEFFLRRFRTATLLGAVERAAPDLRASGRLGFGESGSIPVDLDEIVRRVGVRVCEEASVDAEKEAELVVTSSGFLIRVRPESPPGRRRFSIAHEIGHTLFYSGLRHQVGRVDRREIDAEEFICDRLASALLMPSCETKALFRDFVLGSAWSSLMHFDHAARRLSVSLPALVSRLRYLQGIDAPLIVVLSRSSDGQTAEEEPLSRVWFSTSFGFARQFIIWNGRTLGPNNLAEADQLFKSWRSRSQQHPLEGRFVLTSVDGCEAATPDATTWTHSNVNVSTRSDGRWTNDQSIAMRGAHMLYARRGACVSDAYVISLLTPDESW
jgi:Zn-dependent peptidase ImmA (M78 family)